MGDYKQIIDKFIEKWSDEGNGIPQKESDLLSIQSKLICKFPNAYCYLILEFGDITTQRLMASIADGDYELPDLLIFYSLEKAIQTTHELYTDGLPDRLFSFASSMLGNQFCFDLDECSQESYGNAAVLCFFQDDKKVYYIADSFTLFIEQYMQVKNIFD